jgi:hypothetical protein
MTTAMAVSSSAVVGFQNIHGMRDGYGFYNNAITFTYTVPAYMYNGQLKHYDTK